MRHFVVLGFTSNSQKVAGEILYLGNDREEALAAVNKPGKGFIRQELYELATPQIRRHMEADSEDIDMVDDDPEDVDTGDAGTGEVDPVDDDPEEEDPGDADTGEDV